MRLMETREEDEGEFSDSDTTIGVGSLEKWPHICYVNVVTSKSIDTDVIMSRGALSGSVNREVTDIRPDWARRRIRIFGKSAIFARWRYHESDSG